MSNEDPRTQELVDEFTRRFQSAPTHISVGPGRVNLIGEHTDYNDGFVLPIALSRDIRIALRPRTDRTVRAYSLEYDDWYEFSIDDLKYDEDVLWSNYMMGMAWVLEEQGVRLQGMDAVVSGNVPRASGLSSSAALEVATGKALLVASGQPDAVIGVPLATSAQRAENKFVGVNCGIMDQFISVLGAEDNALLIDCRSLEYRLIPFPAQAALVIGNTKASRSLAGSAYNERRSQCEQGVALLQQELPDIAALRDVTSEQLEAHKHLLPELVYRRCRHVVSENERVMQTVDAQRRPGRSGPPDGRQPRQPARRLRGKQRSPRRHGRRHAQRRRLHRRAADGRRLRRLRHRPGRAGQRTGRGRRHLRPLSQSHQHLAGNLHQPPRPRQRTCWNWRNLLAKSAAATLMASRLLDKEDPG